MKKIYLTAAALAVLFNSYAQSTNDSSAFKSRKLKIEEINLISSYYDQDGDHASVTGGLGSEKLTDLANVIDVKLTFYDKKYRKHNFDLSCGIDQYTSASSDKIDLQANSSASHADTRVYPAFDWSVENEKKGRTSGIGLSYSTEYDYSSVGGNINFSKKTKNRNGEFTAKLQTYFDALSLISPVELRKVAPGGKATRNTYAGSLSYSQIINERFQIMFLADAVLQQGYLSLPFHRVYFNDQTVHQENLPNSRLKFPLALRANYFLGDKLIIKTYYRFYADDWDLKSNTFNLELPVKISPFFSVSPFYRFYNQTAIDYFKPFQEHTQQNKFYTSNYDLSKFSSNFIGTGIRLTPPKGIFAFRYFNSVEIRYGHYSKSNGMAANIISVHLQFK